MVELMDTNTNDPDNTSYIIKFLRGNITIVTNAFIKSRNVPYIGSIPIPSEDYTSESNNITQEQIENITFPEVLSTLQN